MQTRNANALACALNVDLDPTTGRERQLVHGDLIAFGQIGIKVVLARETRARLYVQVQGQRGAQRELHRTPVKDREGSGQPEAYRAGIRVWRSGKTCGAGAKNLGRSFQLRVDFEPDHGLVGRH